MFFPSETQARAELGMTDEIIPPALLTLLGENFDPAVGNAHDDDEALPSELENVSTRTVAADERTESFRTMHLSRLCVAHFENGFIFSC